MRITVFGASGRVGQLVVELSLARGHSVTAFVHAHNPFEEQAGLRVITGDINNAGAVAAALEGSQAVISTLGSWRAKQKDVLTSAMQTIIPAMKQQGITRIITLTGTAAYALGDRPTPLNKVDHLLLGAIAPKILRDGEAHIALLATSGLEWTTVRSPVMTKRAATAYGLRTRLPSGFTTVPRAAVAACLVDQLEATDFLERAPTIFSSS